jgi:hypothetical protein
MTNPEWADYHGRWATEWFALLTPSGRSCMNGVTDPLLLRVPHVPHSYAQLCCSCSCPPPLSTIGGWPLARPPQSQGESPVSSGSLPGNCILGIILRTPVPNAYDPSAAPGHNQSTPLFLSSYPLPPFNQLASLAPSHLSFAQ